MSLCFKKISSDFFELMGSIPNPRIEASQTLMPCRASLHPSSWESRYNPLDSWYEMKCYPYSKRSVGLKGFEYQ